MGTVSQITDMDSSAFSSELVAGLVKMSLMPGIPAHIWTHGQGGPAMKNAEDTDYAVKEGKREEMHCTKCGTYLGLYGPGSDAIVPGPKCKEPNVIDYTGEEFVVKRRKRGKRT